MLSIIVAGLLQVAPSAADMDARFKALKAQTDALSKIVKEGEGPKPTAKNGASYGAYRVDVTKGTMTDEREVSIRTKAVNPNKSNVHMTVRCDGKMPEILYYFDRIVIDDDVLRWSIRVDQNDAISLAGSRTRDLKGVFIEFSMLDITSNGSTLFLQMVVGKQVRIRVIPEYGNSIEHVFSLNGFSRALRVLPCTE